MIEWPHTQVNTLKKVSNDYHTPPSFDSTEESAPESVEIQNNTSDATASKENSGGTCVFFNVQIVSGFTVFFFCIIYLFLDENLGWVWDYVLYSLKWDVLEKTEKS